MYVCMYVYIYICMYVCMYISIYVYICMYVRTYVYMYVYVYVICMCVCMYVCMCVYIYIYRRARGIYVFKIHCTTGEDIQEGEEEEGYLSFDDEDDAKSTFTTASGVDDYEQYLKYVPWVCSNAKLSVCARLI